MHRRFSAEVDAVMQLLVEVRDLHQPEQQISDLQAVSNPVAPVNDISGLRLPIMTTRRQAMHEMVDGAIAILFFSPYALLSKESQEQLALAQIHPSYLDENALNDLSSVTANYWRMLKSAPLDTLVGVASHHFEIILQFLKDPHSASISNRLHALASETAPLIGRIFHLIREYDLASRYYTFAVKLALDIGHTDLWAAGVGRIAMLDLYWGDPRNGLPFLQAAQHKMIHDMRLGTWLSAIEAEIHAEMGESDACTRLLEHSKKVTLPASLEHDIYWTDFDPSLLYGYEGACYVRLRKPDKALDPLQQSLKLIDPAYLREQSTRTTDIGRVHAQLGNPTEASKLLSQALDMITQTRSLSGLQRVYNARAELDPWKNSPEVQALDNKLSLTVKALKM